MFATQGCANRKKKKKEQMDTSKTMRGERQVGARIGLCIDLSVEAAKRAPLLFRALTSWRNNERLASSNVRLLSLLLSRLIVPFLSRIDFPRGASCRSFPAYAFCICFLFNVVADHPPRRNFARDTRNFPRLSFFLFRSSSSRYCGVSSRSNPRRQFSASCGGCGSPSGTGSVSRRGRHVSGPGGA